MEELRSNCKELRYPDAVIDIAIDVERSELYCSSCINQVYDPEIDEAEIGFPIDSQLIIGLGGKSGVDVVAVRSNKKKRLDSQLIIGSQFLVASRDRRGLNNLGSTCFMNAVLRFGETDEPAIYRIKDDLEFSVEILEWSGKSWEPYVADDVQVQFFMMSPYVLKTLLTDKKGLFHTTFKVPDVYGVFQFKVEYEKLGYTTLSLSKQVVTCGSIPLESSYQRTPRCVYVSTKLYMIFVSVQDFVKFVG